MAEHDIIKEIDARLVTLARQRDYILTEAEGFEQNAADERAKAADLDAKAEAWNTARDVLKAAQHNESTKVTIGTMNITGHVDTVPRSARPFRGR